MSDNNNINHNNLNDSNISLFSTLREYKENILIFPSMEIFNIIYKCELLFRKHETDLISNNFIVTDFVQMLVKDLSISFVPPCHNIVYKLIRSFITARIYFSLRSPNNNLTEAVVNSSKSVAMKAYVTKKKCK